MGLDGIRVNHAELDLACENMHQTVKKMDERLNRLESELAPLKSDWHGNAQETYTRAKLQWDTAIKDMIALLDDTKNTVYQSNAEYRAADKRGAEMFEY